MEILSKFSPEIEIYSIDEAFMNFSGFNQNTLNAYCHSIRNTIKQWIGIPVSIGVGYTKTLAKVANRIAKRHKEKKGVCVLLNKHEVELELVVFEVGDVWGIGKSLSNFLEKNGIYYALDFIKKDRRWIRQHMGVVGERIAAELCGLSCLELEMIPNLKRNCCVSRSFGYPIKKIED